MKPWMSKGLNEGYFHTEGDMVYWIEDVNYTNKEATLGVHLGCLYVVLLHFYTKEKAQMSELDESWKKYLSTKNDDEYLDFVLMNRLDKALKEGERTMTEEVLSTVKSALDGMLSELNALKMSVCVTLTYVEQELAKVREK